MEEWPILEDTKFEVLEDRPNSHPSKFRSMIRSLNKMLEKNQCSTSVHPKVKINLEDRSILTDTFFNLSVYWRSTLIFFTVILRKPRVLERGFVG